MSTIQEAIAGRLEFDGTDLEDGHLILTNLRLFTPEGDLVASIARAELTVDLTAIARGRYTLSHVRIHQLRANLIQDERGLNLLRALAPRRPREGQPSPLDLRISELEFDESEVSYSGGGKTVQLERLSGKGEAVVRTLPLSVESQLELTAHGRQPVVGPVSLLASAHSPSPNSVRVEADLTFANERLKGSVDWPDLSSTISQLRVTPQLLTALTGNEHLRMPLTLHGAVSTAGGKFALESGKARATVEGKWTLASRSISDLSIEAHDIDLSEWIPEAPPTRIAASLRGAASSLDPTRLSGELTGQAKWKSPGGAPMVEVNTVLSAKAGTFTAQRLTATLPGATLALTGALSASSLALTGKLEATDLTRLKQVIAEVSGTPLPALGGHGTIEVSASGPPRRPRVTAKGSLSDVRLGGATARQLALEVTAPDITKPLDTDGTLSMTALTVGGRSLDEVKATVATRGRELEVSMTTKGLGDLSLGAQGVLDGDSKGLSLASLSVKTDQETWTLEGASRLTWAPSRRLEQASFVSGHQRVVVAGDWAGKNVRGSVAVNDVELSRLPSVLVPRSWELTGVVTASATLDGTLPNPHLKASARVKNGTFHGLTDIQAQADGEWSHSRARGTLSGATALGSIDSRFDVPVEAVLSEKPDPLEVEIDAKKLELEGLQRWLASFGQGSTGSLVHLRKGLVRQAPTNELAVGGTLDAHLLVKGPASDPAVTVKANGSPSIAWGTENKRSVQLTDTHLTVATDQAGSVRLEVQTRAMGAELHATVTSPFTVPRLRAHLPSLSELTQTPLVLDGSARNLSLKSLAGLANTRFADVEGLASVQVTGRGSIDDPRGLLTVIFENVSAPPLSEVNARLELTAADQLTRLKGSGRMGGKPLFDLESTVQAPLAKLRDLDALGPEHITAHVSLAPLPLERVVPRWDDDVVVLGSLSVDRFDVDGTLDKPNVTVDAAIQNLSFGKVPLGQARLVSRTDEEQQTFKLTLKATSASELRATGTVGVLPSIALARRNFAWASIPVDATVTSHAFDLGFLSGAHPLVRTVGGFLTVDRFKVKGPLADLDVAGEVAWKNGRLGLASYGDYRDIDVETQIARDKVSIERLSVRSGSGGLALDPSVAVRQASGVWALQSSGAATRFSVVTSDQLLAIVSMKFSLEGELSSQFVNITELNVSRADVELPEIKRRKVQSLDRPTDIVLTRQGRIVAGKRRTTSDGRAPERSTSARSYVAKLVAPKNLWLRGSDLNLELGLGSDFRINYSDSLQLFGEANILGGRVDVIGREFMVNRSSQALSAPSTVRFEGSPTQPSVNVTAVHTNEREKVTVTINVVGRGTDLRFNPSSDPPMSESDIYALLATGRRDLRRSSSSSITGDQAVSAVVSYAVNQLKSQLLKRLPIDLFDTVSSAGLENADTARVEFGKYLSDSLYLGYNLQPGANESRGESRHSVRLEYQVSKHVSLEASAGTAPSFGADVVFSRDF